MKKTGHMESGLLDFVEKLTRNSSSKRKQHIKVLKSAIKGDKKAEKHIEKTLYGEGKLTEKIKDKKLQKAIDDLEKSINKFGSHPSVKRNMKIVAGLVIPIRTKLAKMEKQLGEGKLTSEQKLRESIREIIKEQLNEDYKNSEWEVYVKDEKGKEKIVKKAKSKRAATILYNKIIKSDDYYEVGMKVVKEGNLKEAYRSQSIFFDKKDKSKLEKLLKKNKGKFPFNPSGESVVNWSLNDKGSKGLEWSGIPKAKYNKAVEFFMKNKLNPRG